VAMQQDSAAKGAGASALPLPKYCGGAGRQRLDGGTPRRRVYGGGRAGRQLCCRSPWRLQNMGYCRAPAAASHQFRHAAQRPVM